MASQILQQELNKWENNHLEGKSVGAAFKAGVSDITEMMLHSAKQFFQGVFSKVRAGLTCNNLQLLNWYVNSCSNQEAICEHVGM